MHNSVLVKSFVTAVGFGILIAGIYIGFNTTRQLFFVKPTPHVYQSDIRIQRSETIRTGGKEESIQTFHHATMGTNEVVFVGNVTTEFHYKRAPEWEPKAEEIFGSRLLVYRIIPDLSLHYGKKIIGAGLALMIGGLLLVAARDLWCFKSIISENKSFWILFAQKK